MSDPNTPAPATGVFPCKGCGADLKFAPGSTELICPYCGSRETIAGPSETVEELDFHAALSEAEKESVTEERLSARCPACGAETTLDPNLASALCPYCGGQLDGRSQSVRVFRPKSLLPFVVKKEEAHKRFRDWISGLWFAPGTLKKNAQSGSLQGIYLPYWTFDSSVTTRYTGQRGTYYYVTETYTETVNGRSVTKQRQVRRTRWTDVSGVVKNLFDDVLVQAASSLPQDKVEKLEPWDLEQLVPYQNEYIAGFKCQNYSVGLPDAFKQATVKMMEEVRVTVQRDIGGDEQRVGRLSPDFQNITFKHILLPVWLSAYRHGEKVFRFLINARTGEVQGERPWSWAKILLAAGGAAALIATLVSIFGR